MVDSMNGVPVAVDEDVKDGELFNIVQFFEDDSYEYVYRGLPVDELKDKLLHYTQSVGARMGFVRRVIATDMGDRTVFEWRYGEGVVFPSVSHGDASSKV